jgi:hypothetical protein
VPTAVQQWVYCRRWFRCRNVQWRFVECAAAHMRPGLSIPARACVTGHVHVSLLLSPRFSTFMYTSSSPRKSALCCTCCRQSLFLERFTNATSAATRFQPLLSAQTIGTSWIFVDGGVQAAGSFGCTTGLQLIAQSSAVSSYIGTFTLTVSFATSDTAGLLFMVSADGLSYYSVTINAGTGLHTFQVLNSGVATTIGSTSLGVAADAWYTLTVVYGSSGSMTVALNSTQLFAVTDNTLITGSIGLIANTAARFTALSYVTPCFGTCSPTLAQGLCQFTCPTGFIQSGSGTLVCTASPSGASVSWVGQSVNCTLPPPTFFGAYITTPETQVGL